MYPKSGYGMLRGAWEITGNLTVDGNETINGDLSVGGNETITGNLSVGGNETIGGNLSVGGDETITGGLTVGQTLTAKNLNVTGKVTQTIPAPNSPAGTFSHDLIASGNGSGGTWSASEIMVETSIGGTVYKVINFSKSISTGTSGAGGMDGSSASGWIYVYAIYNPTTGASSILGTSIGNGSSPIYPGSNLPSGYTASGHLGQFLAGGSSFFQGDRRVYLNAGGYNVLNAASGSGNVGISSVVPPNATCCGGWGSGQGPNSSYGNLAVGGVGLAQANGGYNLASTSGGINTPYENIPISTPQTISYGVSNGGQGYLSIFHYSF